jgi:hypothetical protein
MITIYDFIRNEYQSLLRRSGGPDTLIAKILFSTVVLMITGYVAAAGYFLPVILKKVNSGQAPLEIINGMMMIYLLVDIIWRLMMQQLPTGIISQYLLINVSRKKIVSFLLIKTFINFITIIGFTLWCSFSISQFGISFDGALWLASVLLFILFNSFLITSLKNSYDTGITGILVALGVILLIGGTNYFGIIHLNETVKSFLHSVVYDHPALILIPSTALCLLVLHTRKVILVATYREIAAQHSSYRDKFYGFPKELSSWSFEWKQLLRNKRIQTMLFMQIFGFSFPIIINIVTMSKIESGWRSLLPIAFVYFLVSIPLVTLSQFIISKDSVIFDKLSTISLSWEKYLKRNITMCMMATLVYSLCIIALLILLSKYRLIPWVLIITAFHLGVTSYIVQYRSTFMKTRFRIDTSAWFNYEGASFAPWYVEGILIADTVIVPILLIVMINIFSETIAMMSILLVGFTGLAFSKQWQTLLYRAFQKRRYSMMDGFRAVN